MKALSTPRALLATLVLAATIAGCGGTQGGAPASDPSTNARSSGEEGDVDRVPGVALLPDQAALSPDGRRLVVPCPDGLCVWSTTDGELTDRLAGGAVVAWSSQDVIATSATTGAATGATAEVVLIDPATGAESGRLTGPEIGVELDADRGVSALAFSPDATTLAAAFDDGTVRLWSVDDGAPGPVLEGAGGVPDELAFDPAGGRLAVAAPQAPVAVWEVVSGELVMLLDAEPQGSLAWSPDAALLATDTRAADDEATVLLWDADTLEAVGTYPEPVQADGLAFSPDSTTLAFSVKSDPDLRLWSLPGAETELLRGHDSAPRAVLFAPDGATVLSVAATDGVLRHEVEGGKPTRFESPLG